MRLMHKYLIIYLFLICPFFFSVEAQPRGHKTLDSVSDKMVSFSPSSIEIKSNLGEKMDLVIAERIKAQDVDHLIKPFRHKDETRLWQSEFWGKWILSAIAAYNYNHDPDLLAIINNAVKGLLHST